MVDSRVGPSKALKYSGIAFVAVTLTLLVVFIQQSCSDYSSPYPQWARVDHESGGVDWSALSARGMNHVDLAQCHAEATYWENLQRRKDGLQGRLQPSHLGTRGLKMFIVNPMYPCPFEERIGRWGDGGKWACMMPRVFQPATIIYSIGSKGSYDFEEQIAKAHNTLIFTFDPFLEPSTEAEMHTLPFLQYHTRGLSGEDDLKRMSQENPDKDFMTLVGLLKMLNHTYVDILKIDCEGCELLVIKDMTDLYGTVPAKLAIQGGALPFGQILMEFHHLHVPEKMLPAIYALENLGYRMFHAEFNAINPHCVEISFIHESLVKPLDPSICAA